MMEGESLFDYFSRLLVIVNRLKRNGKKIKDIRVIEMVRRSHIQVRAYGRGGRGVEGLREDLNQGPFGISPSSRVVHSKECQFYNCGTGTRVKITSRQARWWTSTLGFTTRWQQSWKRPRVRKLTKSRQNQQKNPDCGRETGRVRSTYGHGYAKDTQCYNCHKFRHYASDY